MKDITQNQIFGKIYFVGICITSRKMFPNYKGKDLYNDFSDIHGHTFLWHCCKMHSFDFWGYQCLWTIVLSICTVQYILSSLLLNNGTLNFMDLTPKYWWNHVIHVIRKYLSLIENPIECTHSEHKPYTIS